MFLTIAASYNQSGQAERDKLNNLLAWQDDPAPFKLEALALYYIDNKKYKELKALCLDAGYIIVSTEAFPNRPNFYKDIAKHFLFKQVTRHELVARVALLERLFYSLAMQNVEFFDDELFEYVEENLTSNIRVRFCFSLIIYTKWLLDKKQVNPHMSERLIRLVGLLKIELADSGYEFNEQTPDNILNPEKKDIKELIELCYPVILDFDSQLSFSLSELMKKDELIICFSYSTKRSNQDLMARIIQSKGRLNLNQFDYAIKPNSFYFTMLKIIIFYEKIRVLSKNDLNYFEKELKQITENHPNYLDDVFYCMEGIIFHSVDEYKYRTEFYQYFISIWNAYFPYEKQGSYTYVCGIASALSCIYSFEETIIHLRELKAWNELSNFKKFYLIFILRSFSEKAPTMEQARSFVPEIANMKIWKLSWLVEKLSNFIRSSDSKKVENENKQGYFKFKKKYILGLKEIANNHFAGDKKIFKYTLIGYHTGSSYIDSAKELVGRKGRKLKKKIVFLCHKKGGRLRFKITYPYENIPPGIHFPRQPFLLPYKYVKSARYLFSIFRKNVFGKMEFDLCEFQLLTYEYFIPSMVYYRFFYIPEEIFKFDKENFPSKISIFRYYRCWQVKRALVCVQERQNYKKSSKLKNYVEKVKRRFWDLDSSDEHDISKDSNELFTQNIHGVSSERVQQLQKETAENLGLPTVFRDTLKDGGEGPEMVIIPTGNFIMGMEYDENRKNDFRRCGDALPMHRVEFVEPFAIGKYAITVGEFRTFIEATGYKTEAECIKKGFKPQGCLIMQEKRKYDANWKKPYLSQTENHPVVCISMEDIVEYVKWLREQTGYSYALPSEAAWEYACRAGTTTPFCFGETFSLEQVNCINDWGEEKDKYYAKTLPVGTLPPNAWGLHEVHGNIWERVADYWHNNYKNAPADGSAWFDDAFVSQELRIGVARGGSWAKHPNEVRSSYRNQVYHSAIDKVYHSAIVNDLGFRLFRYL